MSVMTLPPPSASVGPAGTGTRPGRTAGSGTPDPVRAYARSVVSGKTVAGSLVRQACQRHLDDLAHGKERGLRWNLPEAQRVIDLIGQMPQPGGAPFVVQPSQAFIVGSLFGWYLTSGHRRFRTAYVEMGKGNGKTAFVARIGIVCAAADGRHAAEVYTAGVTRDQANYLLNDARLVIEASDTLRGMFEVGAHNLAVLATDSFMRPVSSEARSLDQKRVHAALIDEIHEHETPLVVEKMRAGTKGDDDALIVEITNSGYDRHSVCWQHHTYSRQVLSGTVPNDSWFAYVAGLDEGDDYTDERVWPKANPLLDVTISRRYLREQVQEARDMPPKAALVQRLNFCVWTEASVGAMEMARWDACAEPPEIPAGAECWAGLDLSTTTDLSAYVLLHEDEDGYLNVLPFFWCPAEGVALRSRRDHVPYALWVEQGYLTATEGNVVDYDVIREKIRDLAKDYAVREHGYDRWNATQLVSQLVGDGAPMVPVGQGYASMSAPTKDWLGRIAAGKVRHGGNPVLRWMAANLVVEQDPAGNLKPSKSKSIERIDGQAAVITALSRLIAPHDPVPGEPAIIGLLRDMVGPAPERPEEPVPSPAFRRMPGAHEDAWR
jgi:phage terminase large subunit-like protein